METKEFHSIKRLDTGGTGRVVFATLNAVDRDSDVFLPGSIGNNQVAPVCAAHKWELPAIGKAWLREADDEAVADFALNKSDLAMRWMSAIQFDMDHPPSVMKWSVAFEPTAFYFGEQGGKRVRFLKKVTIHELSPVLQGAGVNTRTQCLNDACNVGKQFDPAKIEKTLQQAQALLAHQRLLEMDKRLAEMNRKRYREVLAIDDWLFEAAHRLAYLAGDELGIRPKAVRFFREAKPGEAVDFEPPVEWKFYVRGFARLEDNEIWIDKDLSGSNLISVVAHEVKHLTQTHRCEKTPCESCEKEANEYAREFSRRFGSIPDSAQIYFHVGRFDSKTHWNAPRNSWLIYNDNKYLYRKNNNFGWEKIRSWR